MTHRRLGFLALASSLLVVMAPQWAVAHPGHGGDLDAGFFHPLTGLDHLLAMVAVGILAAVAGLHLPGVEVGILASVVVLGLLIVPRHAANLGWGAAIVALFAFFHGHAHATEMAASGSLAPYAAGFLLSTAMLHLAGILGAIALRQASNSEAVRCLGAAVAACGVLMLAGWI